MQLKLVKTKDDLFRIKNKWEELTQSGYFSAPFYSWYWYERWWEYFGNGNELFILFTEDIDGRIMAIAPFMKTFVNLRGYKVIEIKFIDNAIGPRNSIIYRDDETCIRSSKMIFDYLLSHRSDWDMINLRSIDREMAYMSTLLKMKGFRFIHETGIKSPYLKIKKDFQTYMGENFNATQRRSRKRFLKKLEKKGECRIVKYQDSDKIHNSLETAFQISKASWKGNLGTDMASTVSSKSFYIDITNKFSKSEQVGIWLLMYNNQPIAVQYHLISGRNVYFLINDFDKAFQKLSPGNALLYHVIETFHQDQVKEFDFGGHDLEYKKKWATDFREHNNIQFFSSSPKSHLIYLIKTKALPFIRSFQDVIFSIFRKIKSDIKTKD